MQLTIGCTAANFEADVGSMSNDDNYEGDPLWSRVTGHPSVSYTMEKHLSLGPSRQIKESTVTTYYSDMWKNLNYDLLYCDDSITPSAKQ